MKGDKGKEVGVWGEGAEAEAEAERTDGGSLAQFPW